VIAARKVCICVAHRPCLYPLHVELYGQGDELRLLSELLKRLDNRTVIDVGAERGSLAHEMLRAGAENLHAFDPHPYNVKAMQARFADDDRVTVHELAVSDRDGTAELHVSTSPDGRPLPFGHTLLERADTNEIMWAQTLRVTRRSLDSLIGEKEIPSSAGILKVDTEGHDLSVIRGMGELKADIVMVEHWKDLPNGLGLCPWTTDEMVSALRSRGFTHFAFIVHRGAFTTLKWDDGEVEQGAMGNLMFLHDSVLYRLIHDVLVYAGRLAEQAVHVGQTYVNAASDRLVVMDELRDAAEERLQALEATTEQLNIQRAELEALRQKSP
jgi:FkbM family methyltransferase